MRNKITAKLPSSLILITLILFVASCKTKKLTPQGAAEKLGENPYFEMNEEPISPEKFKEYDPESIASVEFIYGKEAKKKFGDQASDGAVLIETRDFARGKFNAFFSKISPEYAQMIQKVEPEKIQFILNGEILTENFEGKLTGFKEKSIKELKVVEQSTLSNISEDRGKFDYIVLITAKPSK